MLGGPVCYNKYPRDCKPSDVYHCKFSKHTEQYIIILLYLHIQSYLLFVLCNDRNTDRITWTCWIMRYDAAVVPYIHTPHITLCPHYLEQTFLPAYLPHNLNFIFIPEPDLTVCSKNGERCRATDELITKLCTARTARDVCLTMSCSPSCVQQECRGM